ncbi:hypothetical protein [Halobellus marinus]|uniref:hypothetical protein n=1 Tax=Halobellus TaxID=1073986 RepID=UPI0028ACD23F|nr:hypothetical protein [Halobellus sp. DFY28]
MSDTESESANTLDSDNQFAEFNVSVTTSTPEDTDYIVTLQAQSPSEIWSEIATTTTFRLNLVKAVFDLISGDPPSQWNRTLHDHGITALNGAYADVVRSLAYIASNQSDIPADDGRPLTVPEKINHAFTLTTQFGSPGNSVLGWSLRLDEIKHGPLALIDAASVTQSLGVRIGDQFKDQRADHRREICQLLTWLAETVNLTIIASPQNQAWLRDHHQQHLPECVSEQCSIRVHEGSRFEELIAEAHAQLKPASREVRILRELATHQSQTVSYSTLYESHDVSPSRMRQCFNTLADLDLVRKIQRQNGHHIKLTALGEAYLEQLSDQDSDADQPTGHSSDHSRVSAREEKDNHRAQPRTNETGKVAATRLDRHEFSAIVAGAPQQGIGLVDHPIDRKDDGREPSWYYDAATDRLVVSAEWHNPMQYLVAITHALSHSQIWTTVLPPSRLEETVSLDNLAISDTALLRDARCLGYLSDATETGEQFLAALGDARDELLAMTKNLHHGNYDDRNQHRAAILRNALGLTGTIVHLLDLVGINLTREIRLPDFTRDYGPDRREDVLTNLAMMASIQSKYGAFAAFRQLYEPREKKRQTALTPAIDETDDPVGELIGGFTIVGDGVTELQSSLATDFQTPYTVHDEAPEIAIQIPVHNRTRMRSASETAIRQALSEQESSLQPLCKLLIHAYTGTPYDAARVAQYLSTAYQDLADLTPTELHTGIATLGRNRIFPDENPTISSVTHALLQTGPTLSQADAAEAADVKPRSLRRNETRLSELGLLNETNPEWVLSIPLQAATSIPSSQNQNDVTVNQIRNPTQHTQLMNLLEEKARAQTTNAVSQVLLGDSN